MQRSHFSHIRAVLVVATLGTMFGTAEPAGARRRAAVERGACEDVGGTHFGTESGDFWNVGTVVSEGCELPDGRTIACDSSYFLGARLTKQNGSEW